MIEEGIYEEILEEDYQRYRQQAEKFRETGNQEKAAKYYRKSADIVEQMADLEGSEKLTERRHQLADNLATAAEKLEASDRSTAQSDTATGGAAGSGGGAAGSDSAGSEGGGPSRSPDGPSDDSNEVDASEFLEEPPDIDFSDVGGMTELKQTLLDKVVDPLERPELYETYDLTVVNGVLLYGPPGTGKTYITRALAGKLGYNFIQTTPADVTSSLVGEAADNVANLFTAARDNQPCLVFIDEIDAIAGQRNAGAQKTQSERQMINQLLQELSAIQGEDVVVIAATNMLEEVDDAIKRSGRFDERIEVPAPDEQARIAILRVHLRHRPVLTEDIDWDRIGAKTVGYSASDMELIAANAARKALGEARATDEIQRIDQGHLETAIEETESSLDDWDEP